MPNEKRKLADLLRPLTQEELDKIPLPTEEEIREALRRGREEAERARPFLLPSKGPGGQTLYR